MTSPYWCPPSSLCLFASIVRIFISHFVNKHRFYCFAIRALETILTISFGGEWSLWNYHKSSWSQLFISFSFNNQILWKARHYDSIWEQGVENEYMICVMNKFTVIYSTDPVVVQWRCFCPERLTDSVLLAKNCQCRLGLAPTQYRWAKYFIEL